MNFNVFRKVSPLQLVTYGVALHGLLIVASIFTEELIVHRFHGHNFYVPHIAFGIPLVFGLTLLYVSMYLRRRKWTAWVTTIMLYSFILFLSLFKIFAVHTEPVLEEMYILRGVVLPAVILAGLLYYSKEFTVRSDLRSFAFSARFILLLLAVTIVYGVAGMIIMDKSAFHREISLGSAVHYTVDQLGLTTDTLVPYTRRAKVFLDSLSTVSTAAVAFGLVSLFQPIRARFSNQNSNRKLAIRLLKHYGGNSEDFFKIWPHDKFYYFTDDRSAGLAYGVRRRVALVVGDPFGNSKHFGRLLRDFDEFCRTNDWTPAFVHTVPQNNVIYKEYGYGLQKIGEEAVVNLEKFMTATKRDKYFRKINNRFVKAGYTAEMLKPPHSEPVLSRLHAISSEWLEQPGREERSFMMGYFSEAYMQQYNIMVLRDANEEIQAFVNQIPSYDPKEANFDLLRHSKAALGKSNDFLLMQFIEHLYKEDFERLNLGLCPLSGLDASDEERTVIDNALHFVYANGDRFYSFSGLRRFKSKYKPEWQSRYIAYRGGIRGFTSALTALNRAMKTKHL